MPRLNAPPPPHPAPGAVAAAADILARAERPLIVATRASGGGDARGSEALARLAERFAIPVVEFWSTRNSLPASHPMHGGFDTGPWLAEADAVVVLDALVPWIRSRHAPPEGCPVIQIGPDPLFSELPMRGFPCDVALTSEAAVALDALGAALAARVEGGGGAIGARRARVAERNRDRREALLRAAEAGCAGPMTAAWASLCLDRAKDDGAIVVNELGCDPAVMTFPQPGTYFGHSLAGGLGWGVPAALGAQLVDRDRLVIAAVGDGSYMFANPVACHQVGEALQLPVLTIVFNNGVWDAVRKSTRAVYPDGHAIRSNRVPLTSLQPAPAYERIVAASGGYGERVEHGADLPAALERALRAVREERRQALLNIICAIQ